MKIRLPYFARFTFASPSMNLDNYFNGIDYDPDLLYGGQQPSQPARRKASREASAARDDYETEAPSRRKRQRTATPSDVERMTRRAEEDRRAKTAERERKADRDRMDRDHRERIERARMREIEETERRERLVSERRVRDAERAAEKAARKAEKEAARNNRRPLTEWGIVKFLCDKRTHAFFGVVLMCVAVYLLIAAISFISVGGSDQSVVSSLSIHQITTTGAKVENSSGPVGASLAEMIFAQGLGLGSLTAIVYLAILGLGLMGIKKCSFWSVTFKSLLVAVAISIVGGFVGLWLGSDFLYGGTHGLYVNEFLVRNVDWIGASLVSVILIAAVIYLYLNDIISVYNRYKSLQRARKAKAEQIRFEQEEAQTRVREAMKQSELDNGDEPVDGPVGIEHEAESRHEPISMGFGEEINDAVDEYAINPSDRIAATETASASPLEQTNPAEVTGLEKKVEIISAADSSADSQQSEQQNEQPEQLKETINQPVNQQQEAAPANAPVVAPAPNETQANGVEETGKEREVGFEVTTNTIEQADHISADLPFDPTAELSHYRRPSIDLLNEIEVREDNVDMLEQETNKERLVNVLRQFAVEVSNISAIVGPSVTLYKVVPEEGVRIARIKGLEDDIAMALSAKGIRIIAPIPGESSVGIEVPNHQPQTVSIRKILSSKAFQESKAELPIAMGATISNDVFVADLTKMPHLLVAGATGMGKSVGLNTIIASLLYRKHPSELKLVLIDPKRVEFSNYASLERHFLAELPADEEPIVTKMENVLNTLNSLCVEMEKRYDLLKDAHVVKVTKYNELFIQRKLNPEKGHRYLPYIVVIIDEFADLIMTAGKQVETPIARLAQMARAVGIHLIIATQRPSTNVITGLIKANFPGRIAFRVNQMVDSRTILDCPGANRLNGMGDMLFSVNGVMSRVQCAFIDTPEVHRICDFIDAQAGFEHPYYLPEPIGEDIAGGASGGNAGGVSRGGGNFERDPLFEEVARYVVQTGVASTSAVQRTWRIGYNRAGSIMDQLEAAGIVGPATGGKARGVLVDSMQLGAMLDIDVE